MIANLMLTKIKSLSQSVTLQVSDNGLQFITIKHKSFNAVFALQGAHLLHFQKTQQTPLIWLSKEAFFAQGKAIRGGIPICWPWFGPAHARMGDNLPAHGFARTSQWTITNIEESASSVELEFKLYSDEKTLALWPYQFELTLKATLNQQLKLQLSTTNKSNKAMTYGGALHTYFNISRPQAVQISGLNSAYSNSLMNGKIEAGDTRLTIDNAIDAIYQKSEHTIKLNDKDFQQQVTITNTGNDSEVLWTPWKEGALAFSDMADDGYLAMLCIESAITHNNGQQVPSNETHILTTLIEQTANKTSQNRLNITT